MTQEEKARAYDEALEKAKIEINTKGIGETVNLCKQLFPELRESEDENLKNKSGYYKDGKFWKASTLWNATRNKIPQRVSNIYNILRECTWNIRTLQDFAKEVKNVQEVSLDYPIILDMNGNILDGAHRVVKAYLEGKDINIVYLGDDEWPEPDYNEEKAVRGNDDERIKKSLIKFLTDIKEISESGRTSWAVRKEDAEMCKSFLDYLGKQKVQNEITIEQVYKEFINPEKLKDAKTNKYIRAQLLWELMHNGIITEVDYLYLTDDKRKPWTAEEYRIAYQKGFDMSEQLKQKEQKEESLRDFIDNFHYSDEQKEQKPILEVFGFKVGDAVRLKDGDGRKHIIKSFEEIEWFHGPNFYHVEFEDNSASDGIYPGEEYPNGYYTHMEKLEEVQGPPQEEKQASLTHEPPFDENPSDIEIIEALIHHLNEQDGFLTAINCVSTKAILSWLEKQKEEEGYEAIPVESTLEYKLGFNAGKEACWCPTKEQVNALEITVRLSNFGCDKERRNILLSLLEQLKKNEEKQKEQKPFNVCEQCPYYKDCPNYNEQKPAGATINGEPIPTENKSVDIPLAEWNEEDKKMLNHLIDKIQENWHIRMPGGHYFGITNDEKETLLFTTKEAIDLCDKEIAWLKSLRPQYHGDVTMTEAYKMGFEAGKTSSWKPSEEQMDSLRDTIANTKGYSYSIYLPELYEQLKKLV